MKQRKHKDLIIQWANNPNIKVQVLDKRGVWQDIDDPAWYENNEYRIVPETSDPYYNIKMAEIEGKLIEVKSFLLAKWIVKPDNHKLTYSMSPENYRIYDEHRDLKEAYAAGKTIQYLNSIYGWVDINDAPLWSNKDTYRIKPEDEYVPFTWEDRHMLVGKWFYGKDSDILFAFLNIKKNGEYLIANGLSSEALLANCKFVDGTPCGKKIKQYDNISNVK